MVDDVAVVIEQGEHVVFAHVVAMVDHGGPAYVGAVRVDKDVRPLLKAELDAGVVIVVTLEAGAHGGEGIDEGHLERLG